VHQRHQPVTRDTSRMLLLNGNAIGIKSVLFCCTRCICIEVVAKYAFQFNRIPTLK